MRPAARICARRGRPPRQGPHRQAATAHLLPDAPETTYLLLLPPRVPLLFGLRSHLCGGKEKAVRL